MRSTHADVFNHDDEADGYDADVADESHPVRAGYRATLDWVVARAAVRPSDVVVDLGSGTGNLATRLPRRRRLVCVDVSAWMLAIAKAKLGDAAEYVQSDLLEWSDRPDPCDVVVSTYAIHHLTPAEKDHLIVALAARLAPGGRFVVGDLMAAGPAVVPSLRRRLGHSDVDELFEDEYAWFVDDTVVALADRGFTRVAVEQMTDLSWGVAAYRSGRVAALRGGEHRGRAAAEQVERGRRTAGGDEAGLPATSSEGTNRLWGRPRVP